MKQILIRILSGVTTLDDVHVKWNCLLAYSLQDGRSPLHLAIEKDQTDIVNILITHGANVHTNDMVRNL